VSKILKEFMIFKAYWFDESGPRVSLP